MNPRLKHAIDTIKTSKKEIFLQILIVFILPIALIQFKVISIHTRVPLLVMLVSILVFILLKEQWTLDMLGATFRNFKKFLLPYAIFTLLGSIAIIQFGERVAGAEELSQWWKHSHFVYLFFIVSLFQEVAYRGYLVPALGKLTRVPLYIIFTNAVLFTYLHIIFPNPLLCLPIAAIGGIGFAWIYIKYPSLPLAILSHSVLNFVAVLYGFFVVPGITY